MKNCNGILVCSILILSFQVNLFAQTNEKETELDSDKKIKSKQFAGEDGTFTDSRDGKTYNTIQIGQQTWMAENLNYKSKTGSWIYRNESKFAQTYGRLYSWQAALSACPDGWRLPGDSDWDQLIDFLGGSGEAGDKMKLKDSDFWSSPMEETRNQSGFSALPGGYRENSGNFLDQGVLTFFWSSSEENQFYAWSRGLYVNYKGVYRNMSNKKFGASVRCIKKEIQD